MFFLLTSSDLSAILLKSFPCSFLCLLETFFLDSNNLSRCSNSSCTFLELGARFFCLLMYLDRRCSPETSFCLASILRHARVAVFRYPSPCWNPNKSVSQRRAFPWSVSQSFSLDLSRRAELFPLIILFVFTISLKLLIRYLVANRLHAATGRQPAATGRGTRICWRGRRWRCKLCRDNELSSRASGLELWLSKTQVRLKTSWFCCFQLFLWSVTGFSQSAGDDFCGWRKCVKVV